MKRLKMFCFALLLILTAYDSHSQSCTTMPAHFVSYEAALKFVRSADFKIKEDIKIYKSSWLTNAEYYSCNGLTGIFIFKTKKGKEYMMKDVPVSIWNGFKSASSYGSYYNKYIRGKYYFPL